MTRILHFTTADWKKRLHTRAVGRNIAGKKATADIVIFPGVRVEYHEESDAQVEQLRDASEKMKGKNRLELRPAAQKSND